MLILINEKWLDGDSISEIIICEKKLDLIKKTGMSDVDTRYDRVFAAGLAHFFVKY